MRIQIDKALNHFYMLYVILCKHGNTLRSLTLKGNTISNSLTVYINIVEIPTNKGEHS